MINYPFSAPALVVEQPMGSFYVAILPAELLLEVCYSDALSATFHEGSNTYTLDGTQRLRQPKRLEPIREFINRVDAIFPNAIILAANQRREDGLTEDALESDHEKTPEVGPRWEVVADQAEDGSEKFTLTIPTAQKLAAIIDGQHRLFAFTYARADRLSMSLVCSIFIDLPKPYQAQIFATINSTQKPVDKSLTFELFGYNIADEESPHWSPDKLAVYLSRRLATEKDSPLEGRISIAPRQDQRLTELMRGKDWKVSTAVVVNGIMRLISSNPRNDSNALHAVVGRTRTSLEKARRDQSPLRNLYVAGNDAILYEIVKNYLIACDEVLWSKADGASYITKTVGVQALFDLLRNNVAMLTADQNVRPEKFEAFLAPAGQINFSDQAFKNPSGSGRTFIRKTLEAAIHNANDQAKRETPALK